MALLSTRDFVSVDYEQSPHVHGYLVLARKRTGSYARFVMDNETFTSWMSGEPGKYLASVQELHWGFTGDTEKSLKDELDIETEADREVNRMVREIQDGLVAATSRFIGQPDTEATRAAMNAVAQASLQELQPLLPRGVRAEATVRVNAAPPFIPLRFDVNADMGPLRIPDLQLAPTGQEVRLTSTEPTHLMTFMNRGGRVVAYIDQEGNYVRVGDAGPSPQPPVLPDPPEPAPVLPPLTGRIIDLE